MLVCVPYKNIYFVYMEIVYFELALKAAVLCTYIMYRFRSSPRKVRTLFLDF